MLHYKITTVITNQVQAAPDTFFGDPTKAAGGNVVAHSSTYRIYLRKSGENRLAKMMDSPYHPYSDTRFTMPTNNNTLLLPRKTV